MTTPVTLAATGIARYSATLRASVNPDGVASTVHFEWGTTPAYGSSTTPVAIGSGTAAVPVSTTLTGLLIDTTYYFRAVRTP
jgi:hypothetical protein